MSSCPPTYPASPTRCRISCASGEVAHGPTANVAPMPIPVIHSGTGS
jgi:hypothetical protein